MTELNGIQIPKFGSIISFEPEIRPTLFFLIPLAYVIRLFTWSKTSHVASFCDDKICEHTGAYGYLETTWLERLKNVPKGVRVYSRDPINSLSIEQMVTMRSFNATQYYVKYGVGAATYTALNWIPFINKINFGRKKSACSISVASRLRSANLLPMDRVDPYNINPEELLRRVDKYGLYQKKRRLI